MTIPLKFADVKVRVYRTFGDEAQTQITDQDILRWTNDGQRAIAMQNDTLLQTTAYAQSVNGTNTYNLPSDLLVLRSMRYKRNGDVTYYKMRNLTMQEFDEYIDGWDGTLYQSGWPQVYVIYNNQIILFPIPDETSLGGTANNIKFIYSREPVDVTGDTSPLDLPVTYHNALVAYVLTQAFQLDEDWSAAQQTAQSYEADIKMLKERENWGNREFFPRIVALFDDEW